MSKDGFKMTRSSDMESVNLENILNQLKTSTTKSSEYPNAVRIDLNLIPVYDAQSICDFYSPKLQNLILQELEINDVTSDPDDEEISILWRLLSNEDPKVDDDEFVSIRHFVENYRSVITEIVHSLSLEGPGVCIIENVFSEKFMDKIQDWVDNYLEKDTTSKKDHFAFGTNKRIWRIPEKLPVDLLYNYLHYDAMGGCEVSSPVFNHVIDKFLGQHHIGSLAINQILPGGQAQLTHTDYPPGFYQVDHLRRVFSGPGLEQMMPYFSLQAGIALCDMDSVNGSTAVIPYSHTIQHSDWLIAGAKPKPGEDIGLEDSLNKQLFEAVQPYLIQSRVKKGSCILFNRKLLHQGGANHSDKPRTALLLQAIMPFGVKMEYMENDQAYDNLIKYVESRVVEKIVDLDNNDEDEGTIAVKEKYFGLSQWSREKLHYRLHGPRFPRDMDAASVGEKNN